MLKKGILDFWAYINHLPEEDEEKKHKHVYFVPGKLIDTNQLKEELKEIDNSNPLNIPLGCMPFRSSKFDDWYLYVVHDPGYLISKGQARKYHYSQEEIVCSDRDYLNELVHTIDWSKINQLGKVIEAAKTGDMSFEHFIASSGLSLYQFGAAEKVWGMFNRTMRNGKETHTPIIDDDTGEII